MRIVTAREQAEMTLPWRTAMPDTSYRYDIYDREVPRPGRPGSKAMHEYHANPYWGDPQKQVSDPEAIKAIEDTGGNPDAPVNVYRGVPHGVTDVNHGDWVSPSLSYVQDWTKAMGRKKPMSIIQTQVPAKHLYTDRSTKQEWAYHGPDHQGEVHS